MSGEGGRQARGADTGLVQSAAIGALVSNDVMCHRAKHRFLPTEITASCKTIAKKASEQSVRVERTPWPSPASRRFGIASTRLGASATGSHRLPGSLICLLTLADQDREPHTLATMFDHLAADSRQPQKTGSELHFDMHSRSGFRYRFAARCSLRRCLVQALLLPDLGASALRHGFEWHFLL
jgi:hypothetical protein